MYPKGFENIVEALAENGFWFTALSFLLFLHITAFLSVVVKWGALPLAFAVMVLLFWGGSVIAYLLSFALGGMGFSSPFRMRENEIFMFIMLYTLLLVSIAALEIGIAKRLQAIAVQ